MKESRREKVKVERRGFSVAEMSAAWGLSDPFIRLEIQRGKLKPLRAGKRIIIPLEEINRYFGIE